ncbi:RNA-directed DNA polymerase, eukaryota, reverse transcriptase zinc-binding domain protein [Tanacetum coccineum]|uniref:RNA-directed DNA polymerase, eukaryota, reverse transcriptase zinc-binding domain protein n=1 Tax=Tanacetum coccineum TaxID=301880 RepID=A0ABQ5DHI6_9ASTR
MFCSFVYADNFGMERRNMWKDLQVAKLSTNGVPWTLIGDFNVTLNVNEHSAGRSNVDGDIEDFIDCVNNIKVEDVCRTGMHFTWIKSPKKPCTSIMKKLDRIMANEDFVAEYNQAYVVFYPFMVSDHSPAVLVLPQAIEKKIKSFKFANFVVDQDDFLPIKDGNVFDNVISLRNKLKSAQFEVNEDPFNAEKKAIATEVLEKYNMAVNDEVVKSRKSKNRVISVKNNRGIIVEGDKVATEFVSNFENFLGQASQVRSLDDLGEIFTTKISDEEASFMIRDGNDKEIKAPMFGINDCKSHGPDGYTACFFKKARHVVGANVCKTVKEFFRNGKLLREVNSTLIALIPKVVQAFNVTDYRPIACCNVLYKCISKILTARIKNGLDKVVNLSKSAFIHGRSIQDNILLTQELLKGYNRKGGPKRCSLKIDIAKAYDTVNWGFLRKFFLDLASTNIIHQSQDFKYHAGCKEIGITHLCFADDLLVLCHRSVDSIGTFPIRYLGVPLITKRLRKEECKQLVDKVKQKVGDWKNKFLSYAGRMQLIASVLGSMHVYWASIFLLPMSVVKDIEKVLKGFLWTQGDMARGKAKIAWKTISKNNDSWIWKCLLDLREKARSYMISKIGNGKGTLVWYDNWNEMGPLCQYIYTRDIYDARFDQNATIADMVVDGQWLKDDADIVFWKCNNGNKNAFSCPFSSRIWDALKLKINSPDLPNEWDRLVNEMAARFKNRSIKSIVFPGFNSVCAIWRKVGFVGNVARLEEPFKHYEWGYILHNDAHSFPLLVLTMEALLWSCQKDPYSQQSYKGIVMSRDVGLASVIRYHLPPLRLWEYKCLM